MSALYPHVAFTGNNQVVRRPCRTEAIGGALRGAYGSVAALPTDLTKLLQRLDPPR